MRKPTLELKPMSALTTKIKDSEIYIFEQCKFGVARMVVNDRWKNKACGWCFKRNYK